MDGLPSHHLDFSLERAGRLDRLKNGNQVAWPDTEGVQPVDELLQGGGGTLHVLAERGAIELCCVGRGERHTTSRITWSARWWGARQTATLQRGGGVIFYARFEV